MFELIIELIITIGFVCLVTLFLVLMVCGIYGAYKRKTDPPKFAERRKAIWRIRR